MSVDQLYNNSMNFNDKAITIFNNQRLHIAIYKQYLEAINFTIKKPSLTQVPFLPIELFKTHAIKRFEEVAVTFKSSGTMGGQTSKHFVNDINLYINSFMGGLNYAYGNLANHAILGLLPNYLEQGDSSLVYMVNHLIKKSTNQLSNTYLNNFQDLYETLKTCEQNNLPAILIGVTYALLDFVAMHPIALKNTIVMETGGMKGRKQELTRQEVHQQLKQGFTLENVHSEYGMTELLSQAYSKADGIFYPSPTMKVLVRDINDPFSIAAHGKGALNIIDLANVNSVSFIATSDVGEVFSDGSFVVNGRLDNSDIRGCSLLAI